MLLIFAISLPGSAHAFTFDNQSGNNRDGSARFTDPDALADGLTAPRRGDSGSMTLFRNGNSSLSFGMARPDDRPPAERAFPFRGFGVRPFPVPPSNPN
ncbi:MAG TPA: hypothetical protein VFA50_09440 [Stellaceae bacterium]|nr:hypothetical protein [Stellaceae bacterium]